MYIRTRGFGTAATDADVLLDTSGSTVSKTDTTIVRRTGIAGRVVDPSGVGVAGATVRAVASGVSIRATTGATGAFSLQCQPRTYVLLVHAEGIGDTQVGEIEGGAVVSGVVVVAGSSIQVGDILVGTAVVDSTCPEGTEMDATGNCVPIVARCPDGTEMDATGNCVPIVARCPDGTEMDATGNCVPITTGPDCTDPANAWMVECADREKGEEPSPWYASPWVWVGAVVLVGGGIYLATRKR